MRARLLILLGIVALLGQAAVLEKTGPVTQKGDNVLLRCGGGQSTAIVYIPSTTGPGPTPTPIATGTPTAGPTSTPITFGGTVTVYVAPDLGGFPGPTESPYLSLPAHSNVYTVAASPPAELHVWLASDQWIAAVYTSPNPATSNAPGPRANLTVTCSGAEAPFPSNT
jgi:hypothetical protein